MTYVISDLHGYPLKKLKQLFELASFGEDDFCFILGDVIDRGVYGAQILKWLLTQPNIQLILGNHEAMMLSCRFLFEEITEKSIDALDEQQLALYIDWMGNGGDATTKGLAALKRETVLDILEYLEDAPLFEVATVNGKEFVLTHSGLGKFSPDKPLEAYTPIELLWNRPKPTDEYYADKTVVFGHTPTVLLDAEYRERVMFTKTWIDIDTGAAGGLAPTLLCLDTMTEYRLP